MNPTTRAILQTVMTSDSSLSEPERGFVQRLLDGDFGESAVPGATASERLLVTQKRAAELLSVNRVTIWRMTRDGMLNPVEILPGTLRYRLNEITRLAQTGTASELRPRGSRGLGAVASAA
jgi:Predicted site-specific integrase-resolvase